MKDETSRRMFKLSKDAINYLLHSVDSVTWRIFFCVWRMTELVEYDSLPVDQGRAELLCIKWALSVRLCHTLLQ